MPINTCKIHIDMNRVLSSNGEIFLFRYISGGHVNPAVSLAMAAIKKVSPLRASLFVVAQCGGGIAGAALLYG